MNQTRPSRPFIFYPILLVLYFFLHFYSVNSTTRLFPTEAILTYLALTLVVAAGLWAALARLWKDAAKAAILVSVLVFLTFSYGHLYEVIYFRKSATEVYVIDAAVMLRSHLVLLLAWALLAAAAVMLTIARGARAYRLTGALNAATAVLCLFPLVTIAASTGIFATLTDDRSAESSAAAEPVPIQTEAAGYEDTLPDIYYIILDAYTRDDALLNYYGYHNTFVDFLDSRGFYVAPESNANYPDTLQALPASLNMRYVTADEQGEHSRIALIRDNVVCRTLRDIGYQYVVLETLFTGVSTCADIRVANAVNNLDVMFLKTTLARPLLNQAIWAKPTYQNHLDRVEALLEIPEIEGPTFTFAHFILPHDPYVFDREGNQIFLDDFPMGSEPENQAYLDQLIYTNVLFTRVVEEILAKSDVPPIIIIQGDHGSHWAPNKLPSNPDYLRTRFTILNAYHFPNGGAEALYPSITPVNSFRVLLNTYFDAGLELLPDESYIWIPEDEKFLNLDIPPRE